MSSNKQLDTLKEVVETEDFKVGGLDDLDSLVMAANSAESVRRRYLITLDATGSMDPYWTMAKSAVREAIKQIKTRTHVPVLIKVLAYRDKEFDSNHTEMSEWSDDEEYLSEWISNVESEGGGDGPESVEIPLADAVHDTPNTVIMLGDAPGKHRQSGLIEAGELKKKQCPVYTLYLNDYCKQSFEDIARVSGGKAFNFNGNAKVMEDVLLVILSQDKALQISYQPTTIEGKKYLEGMK